MAETVSRNCGRRRKSLIFTPIIKKQTKIKKIALSAFNAKGRITLKRFIKQNIQKPDMKLKAELRFDIKIKNKEKKDEKSA